MGKKIFKVYWCDLCKKEVESEDDLQKRLKNPYYDKADFKNANHLLKMEICDECRHHLKVAVKDQMNILSKGS